MPITTSHQYCCLEHIRVSLTSLHHRISMHYRPRATQRYGLMRPGSVPPNPFPFSYLTFAFTHARRWSGILLASEASPVLTISSLDDIPFFFLVPAMSLHCRAELTKHFSFGIDTIDFLLVYSYYLMYIVLRGEADRIS